MACLHRLSASRGHDPSRRSGYRMLFTGVSNMEHTFFAVEQDDSELPWLDKSNTKWQNRSSYNPRQVPCGTAAWKVPDLTLQSFAPHAIDYQIWQVVSNASIKEISKANTDQNCFAPATPMLGGGESGGLSWIVKHAKEPYDAVIVYVGPWDASFTGRDISRFERGLEASVSAVRTAWPTARVLLFTCTPPGPMHRANETFHRDGSCTGNGCGWGGGAITPMPARDWVPVMNAAIRRVVERHAPLVTLLDAHQMTTSRPDAKLAGYPPGVWLMQKRGWHFSMTSSRADMVASRKLAPPSAKGEMYRAFANRVFDELCPPHREPRASLAL